MSRTLNPIHVTDSQQEELRSWARRHGLSQGLATRAHRAPCIRGIAQREDRGMATHSPGHGLEVARALSQCGIRHFQ